MSWSRCRNIVAWPSVAAMIGATGIAARAQDVPLLTYGITGSTASTPDDVDPTTILGHVEVQRLLLAVAATPRDQRFLDSSLAPTAISTSTLERAGLVRRDGSTYGLAFALLSRHDVALVRRVADALVPSLAAAYIARGQQFDSLFAMYPIATVDRRAVAFVTIGCFSLDWDGLRATVAARYRAPPPPRPWGARYLIWAEERAGTSLKGVYWGSHYTDEGPHVLTTFGDHFALPRLGFPDMLGRLSTVAKADAIPDSATRVGARTLAADGVSNLGDGIATVMMALRTRDRTLAEIGSIAHLDAATTRHLVALLEATHYVVRRGERIATAVPVLSLADSAMVRGAMDLSHAIFMRWLSAHYEDLRRQLADLAPVREGLPFEDVFTQVWHYLFGLTNRELVRQGLFADPYARPPSVQGFFPVIWSTGLVPEP